MRIAGIVLIVLQVLAIVGSIINGSLAQMLSGGIYGVSELIGFFLPSIIGVILLNKAKKK